MVGERWRDDAETGRLESARELVLVLTLLRALHIARLDIRGAGRQKGWRWTRATLRELITLFEDQEGQDLNYAVTPELREI